MCRIEYFPQTFASADQMENYDSDGSVAYGEKFTAIKFKIFEELEFLKRRTFAWEAYLCAC